MTWSNHTVTPTLPGVPLCFFFSRILKVSCIDHRCDLFLLLLPVIQRLAAG